MHNPVYNLVKIKYVDNNFLYFLMIVNMGQYFTISVSMGIYRSTGHQ